jgi:hypothetical protein
MKWLLKFVPLLWFIIMVTVVEHCFLVVVILWLLSTPRDWGWMQKDTSGVCHKISVVSCYCIIWKMLRIAAMEHMFATYRYCLKVFVSRYYRDLMCQPVMVHSSNWNPDSSLIDQCLNEGGFVVVHKHCHRIE